MSDATEQVALLAAIAEVGRLRNEIARLNNQTNWVCSCGGTDTKGQKENEEQARLLGKGAERETRLLGRIGELQKENAALGKDKGRLDWLTNSLGWIVVGEPEADPSQHATEDGTLADAWRAAIDAARKERAR